MSIIPFTLRQDIVFVYIVLQFFDSVKSGPSLPGSTFSVDLFKAKFHYAIWFEAGSKLVADLQRAEIWPII